jgi:hypothetical protein
LGRLYSSTLKRVLEFSKFTVSQNGCSPFYSCPALLLDVKLPVSPLWKLKFEKNQKGGHFKILDVFLLLSLTIIFIKTFGTIPVSFAFGKQFPYNRFVLVDKWLGLDKTQFWHQYFFIGSIVFIAISIRNS